MKNVNNMTPAAHKGARHWLWQRATAIALVPLTLWFVFAIIGRLDSGAHVAYDWVAQPGVAIALLAYLAAVFTHSQLGLQVIAEDYIHSVKTRAWCMRVIGFINMSAAVVSMASVARIAFLN